ncbi:MAG: helix-turn-helix domain-containing protein [Lachnospiraceae bacterium]|nr:helix-turn-helix domain-containing protein [Lachnospiraceae bacterium]
MEKEVKPKNDELIALRFKEVRKKYFHGGVMKEGKRRNNTQDDFAEYLGVTPQTIGNYESGRTTIKKDHLIKLSNDFGIRLKYLLGEDDYETETERIEAQNAKDWEEKIIRPMETEKCVIDLWNKLGFELVEREFTNKDFNVVEMHFDNSVSKEDVIRNFEEAIQHADMQRYECIKYNNNVISLLSKNLDSIIADIIGYARFKIEREFRKKRNYHPFILDGKSPNTK